jgi:16S rRNA processing protein RimM
VLGAFGVRGDVNVAALEADAFKPGMSVTMAAAGRIDPPSLRVVRVQHVRAHAKGLILRFEGIDDRDTAAALHGARLLVPARALPKLPKGSYRAADLVGLGVWDAALGFLGNVTSVRRYPSCDMLVVGDKELLVPLLAAYGAEVHLREQQIRVTLPAGFEELSG